MEEIDTSIYLPIWNFEKYEINSVGVIRNSPNHPYTKRNRGPTCYIDADGRRMVRLWIKQEFYECFVDELVSETFAGFTEES